MVTRTAMTKRFAAHNGGKGREEECLIGRGSELWWGDQTKTCCTLAGSHNEEHEEEEEAEEE